MNNNNIVFNKMINKINESDINSEDLRKYLQLTNKNLFNKMIVKYYKLNKDYKIELKLINPNLKSDNQFDKKNTKIYKNYLLTSYCAKKICLYTNSKMKKEIYEYFLNLDYLLLNNNNNKNETNNILINDINNNMNNVKKMTINSKSYNPNSLLDVVN